MKTQLLFVNQIIEQPLIILIIGVFITIVFFVVIGLWLTFQKQQTKHLLAIQQRIHHYLVYRVNLKLDVIYEFDPKHPGKDKLIPVSSYLRKFPAAEAEKIYQWWEKLLRAKLDTPWILTTKFSKRKKSIHRQLIFEVIRIDENKQTIHFHQYGLKYLKPNPKKFVSKQVVITSQQAMDVIKKLPSKQGSLISIFMMFPRAGLDEQFKYFYLSQIKEKLLPYLSNQILLIDTANDILVFVTKPLETHAYMQIAQSLFQVISQYVEVNALESLIKFNMALIEHKHFPNDLKTLIRTSKELNQIMMKRKISILTYEKHQPVAETIEKNETLFADDFYRQLKFSLVFRPLISQPDVKQIGQQVMIQPSISTSLTTLEMLQEAPLMMNYTKEFYRRYLYYVQQALMTETSQLLVPFSIAMKLQELSTEIKALNQPEKLLILLDEVEVKDLAVTDVSLKTWAEPLKRLGIRFVLALDDKTANLDDSIYQFFDFLLVDYKQMINVENVQKTSIQLKLIFQNFLRFDIPFIVIDMLSESSLELIPLKHVKILSADWIMGFQTQQEEISKRQLNKITNLLSKQENYHGKTN